MKRTLTLLVVLFALVGTLFVGTQSAAAAPGQIRIYPVPGAELISVGGTVSTETVDTYVFWAAEGEVIDMNIVSSQEAAYFTLYTPDGMALIGPNYNEGTTWWYNPAPMDGDYRVEVSSRYGLTDYTLDVALSYSEETGSEETIPIHAGNWGENWWSATMYGWLDGEGDFETYNVWLNDGEYLSLMATSSRLNVNFDIYDEQGNLIGWDNGEGGWYGQMMTTGTYYINVYNGHGNSGDYLLNVYVSTAAG